jgi:hypothetical protein
MMANVQRFGVNRAKRWKTGPMYESINCRMARANEIEQGGKQTSETRPVESK